MKYDIQTLEGAVYYINITITNKEDISDYSIYGNCVCRCGKCYHFEITEHTETGCKVAIPPLCYGIYNYQLFAKNTNNEEHLLLQGDIVADNVQCPCETNVSVPIYANTIELKLEIKNIIHYDKNNLVYTFGEDGTYAIEGDLSGLTDHQKYNSWNVDLPNLTNGSYMFYLREGLTSFSSDLSALTNGSHMFWGCSNLTQWNNPLPNLTDGMRMFYTCFRLNEWNTPLPNLTNGYSMFQWCENLTSFKGNLPALTDGTYMFGSSTTNCTKLDLASVQNIAETINTVSSGTIHIGISSSIQSNDDLETALAIIRAKGWTVNEIYA